MVSAVGGWRRHCWKTSAEGLQAPETLGFWPSSQHCPLEILFSSDSWQQLNLLMTYTKKMIINAPLSSCWRKSVPSSSSSKQLSTPECNLLGAAKSLSTHLHMSCHWGKHWMATGWAWVINPAGLWNSTGSVRQMGPLWPVSLLLCCLKCPGHITLPQISHHTIRWWNSLTWDKTGHYMSEHSGYFFYLFIYAAEFHYQHRVKSAWCWPVQNSCFWAHREDLSDAGATAPECQRWEVCH